MMNNRFDPLSLIRNFTQHVEPEKKIVEEKPINIEKEIKQVIAHEKPKKQRKQKKGKSKSTKKTQPVKRSKEEQDEIDEFESLLEPDEEGNIRYNIGTDDKDDSIELQQEIPQQSIDYEPEQEQPQYEYEDEPTSLSDITRQRLDSFFDE